MVRTAVLTICLPALLFAAAPVGAEPEPFMRRSRPNELGFTLTIHEDCSAERADFERLVARAFRKHWLERIDVEPETPYLRIEIWCDKTVLLYPFTIVARFAEIERSASARPRSLAAGYEASGAGSYERFLRAANAVITRAIDDHISANFDL